MLVTLIAGLYLRIKGKSVGCCVRLRSMILVASNIYCPFTHVPDIESPKIGLSKGTNHIDNGNFHVSLKRVVLYQGK